MALRLGLVGRGYWGNVYAKVLTELGIEFVQYGRDWSPSAKEGIIVACSTEAHYSVAKQALLMGLPILVEKPVTLRSVQARELASLGGIGFVSHTRLYSPSWADFKREFQPLCAKPLMVPQRVEAWAGGVNETNPDALWNWLPHLIPMCLDLGFDPLKAEFHITEEKQPLRFVADGREFVDGKPGALANLVTQFCEAIKRGEPDNRGLELGARVVELTEQLTGA